MQKTPRDSVSYWFDKADAPVSWVAPGERFVVETHDCRTGTITSEAQTNELGDLRFVNPATGPIAIRGVAPGDVIRVAIHEVRVCDRALMIVRPGATAFRDVTDAHIRMADVREGTVQFSSFRVRVDPMVGVVGITPAGDPIRTTLGGRHGGNMDTRLVGPGSFVYLEAEVPHGMLYIGDLHAAMGDGEVFLTGVEIAGEVEASVDIVQDAGGLPLPLVETGDVIAPIQVGPTLDEAAIGAIHKAQDLLVVLTGLSRVDAGFLLSAACDLRVSQFLPGNSIHARVEIPKAVLRMNGFRADIAQMPA